MRPAFRWRRWSPRWLRCPRATCSRTCPPREERRRPLKRDDATNLAPVEIGVRGSELLLPRGLVSGVQLESVLRSLSNVQGFQRFDQLPLPFRAVATDLVSGRPVVIDRGELPAAMRASMSVPGVIEPARLEGRCWWTVA
jgi:NTE family protein